MSNLKNKINEDFIAAFKAKDMPRKNTLGMLKAAITESEKEEKNKGKELTDEQVLKIVQDYAKKLNQTIDAINDKGNKLSQEAVLELETVSVYLPARLSQETIDVNIKTLLENADLTNKNKTIGTVMNYFKQNYNGRYNPLELKSSIEKQLL